MRHRQTHLPFDVEAQEADDLTREFWGGTRGWVSKEHPTVEPDPRRDDTTGSMRALRDGLAAFRPRRVDGASRLVRTREHGAVRSRPHAREATLGELASGSFDPFFDEPDEAERTPRSAGVDDGFVDEPTQPAAVVRERRHTRDQTPDPEIGDEIPLTPVDPLARRLGAGAVDPLLLRLGAILLVGVLLVPFARAVRSDDDGSLASGVALAAEPNGIDTVEGAMSPTDSAAPAPTSTQPAVSPSAGAGIADSAPATPIDDQAGDPALVESSTATDPVSDEPAPDGAEVASVAAFAERVVPACPQTYEASFGDSWYRIADAAGISPADLLAENRATLDSVILPGDEICLTADATVPSPPTTAPAQTATTSVAAAPAPANSLAAAPTTTEATTTTTAPPPAPPAPDEVERIIRDVWPDELEEKALQIAHRESRYQADAYNGWCCYGLFQIHWGAHSSWLDDFGILSTNGLLDARKNTEAAYEIYRRAGGWGPWGG